MSEVESSIGIAKRGTQPKLGSYTARIQIQYMRKILSLLLVTALAALGAEGISSYVLYRHFSSLHRGFYPSGSATMVLARDVIAKVRGRRDEVDLSIDHGPL